MNKKTEIKVRQGDPELTTSKKLDQIKTGAKTVVQETEEKFEETAVLRKKRNYVMYESKLGTEKNTEITQIAAPKPAPKPKPKPVREPSPRVEEKIVIKKKKREYLDNYQYHETKNIKNKNPRYQVIVEHKRLGDIIGGTFEETSYQRQIFAQGSSRPQIVEQTTTQTATGSANTKLRANKSESRLVTKTKIESAPQKTETTSTKTRTTKTTTTKTESTKPAQSATAKAEKITETTMKRRNEGTGSTTTSRTEKTTTTGGAGASSSTTTKTTTRTISEKPGSETRTQQSSTTTTTTKTTTTRTSGNEGGKTETKTVTKVEESSSGDAGASSIRKKYAKGRFKK